MKKTAEMVRNIRAKMHLPADEKELKHGKKAKKESKEEIKKNSTIYN